MSVTRLKFNYLSRDLVFKQLKYYFFCNINNDSFVKSQKMTFCNSKH